MFEERKHCKPKFLKYRRCWSWSCQATSDNLLPFCIHNAGCHCGIQPYFFPPNHGIRRWIRAVWRGRLWSAVRPGSFSAGAGRCTAKLMGNCRKRKKGLVLSISGYAIQAEGAWKLRLSVSHFSNRAPKLVEILLFMFSASLKWEL